MTYTAWAIMVLIPMILTTILVLIAWGEVSFKKGYFFLYFLNS
jgi:hypothetical protein